MAVGYRPKMNENLAYWQLDFTVERQAIWPQIAWLCRKNPRAFDALGGPQNPGLLYSRACGLRPRAVEGHPLFSDIFFKAWSHPRTISVICLDHSYWHGAPNLALM